jgi:protein-disulfide isomerase
MENKNAMYFFGLLLLVMTFTSGYYMGKSKATTITTAAPAQQQQQPGQPVQPQVSIDTIKGLFSKNLVKFGKGDKKLLLVEVSDPSCPFCHVAGGKNKDIGKQMGAKFMLTSEGGTYVAPVPEMKKLVDQGKADFVWIYSPGHGNGEMGTKALYCAYDQGKFWQANDLLMSAKGYDLLNNTIKNDKSKSQDMANFLAPAVDEKKLKECLDSGKYDTRLTEETALATQLGVNGTPGFFLNTTNFAGAYAWTDMKSVASAAL